MKEIGLNTVVAHIDWYDREPHESIFDLSRSDVVIELAEKLGLNALVWAFLALKPEWLGKFLDALWIAADNRKPDIACWDHPGAREVAGRFITNIIQRYRSSKTVLGWDVADEPSLWVSASGLRKHCRQQTYCYCPYMKVRYRA